MTDIVDWTHYFFAVAVLAILVGALGLFGHAVRKGWILQNVTGLRGFAMGNHRRLRLKETLVIDPRRRLVIVQADATEHVVLLGAEAETVLASQPAPPEPEMPLEAAS
ncbi:flagellar biosynthetic protein FliO [Maricaulis sp.]|jgi:flagellar protein FliO/FliZ|uniref:flagellar biosynthetic protein FliO n=1 Tax=Maricaulis sp. TaxID=1486257 RepID=UPI002616B2C7|nr:flagellar biosynthetic protein FliO [Maricaulis sp.]